MGNSDWSRLETLFFRALEVPEGEQESFLLQECRGDEALAAEVLEMVRASDRPDDLRWLNRLERDSADSREEELPTRHVGPYRIISLLGRGGMGAVYLAERDDDQYRQRVAVKLVRSDLATSALSHRLRTERQILAGLKHPNISTLLDGGVTRDGRPYLVMQYESGLPITEYCDEHRLTIPERLELFAEVCEAVQYAHGNLVVHRDLKPSNILVAERGEPKLLDFGIAKILEGGLDITGPPTENVRLLTPEHAAPEQIKGDAVTTATDVYGLGILLYELLAGERPFRAADTLPLEFHRRVCEDPPTRPSEEVSANPRKPAGGDRPGAVARLRNTTPPALVHALRGDLDQIVMMALRKEPTRRYGSAGQLAEDVRRYLGGHPVIAQPDRLGYRVRKFLARHYVATAATAAIVLLLATTAVYSTLQAQRTQAALAVAERERDRAEQVGSVLLGLFESANPDAAPRDTLRVGEILERGLRRAAANLAGQPDLVSEVYALTGQAYSGLGRPDLAGDYLDSALVALDGAPLHDDVRRSDLLYTRGAVAEERFDFQEALEFYERSLEAATRAGSETGITVALSRMMMVNHWMGRPEVADTFAANLEARLTQVVEIDDPRLAFAFSEMSYVYLYTGDLERAERYARIGLDGYRSVYGERHPQVREGLLAMTEVNAHLGRYEEARRYALERAEVTRDAYPEENTAYGEALAKLAEIELSLDPAAAEEHARQALAELERATDELELLHYPRMLLGKALRDQGRFPEAEQEMLSVVDALTQVYGVYGVRTIEERGHLALIMAQQGRVEEAETILLRDYEYLVTERGRDSRSTQTAGNHLAELYEIWNRPEMAAEFRSGGTGSTH
jgi:serine/threonine-protein kinase